MSDLFAKYSCTYCQEDINGLRIKCAECPDFDLCLQCFSAGAEIGNHKNNHAYQFVDSSSLGLGFGRGEWSALEELNLLSAVEQYGFGNWGDISKHIETRTPEEAKEEYVARFIEGNIGRLTWPPVGSTKSKLVDHTSAESGPLSPPLSSRIPPLDISNEEAALLEYMPLRDDFEREYDNTAEIPVSSLSVSLEDDELDIVLKLAQVDMYTRRLRERARRKRIVRDYQLVQQFFSSNPKDRSAYKKKLAKEGREFQDRLRVYARFLTSQEFEQFVQSLQNERALKIRINELIRYRKHGLTKHEECTFFEQQRISLDEWKEKKSGSSGSINSPPSLGQRKRERNEGGYPSTDGRSALKSNQSSNLDSSGEGGEAEKISSSPQYRLLSQNEIKLCTTHNLNPAQYITLKAAALKDCSEKGVKKEDISALPPLESHILKYLVNSGWITAS